MSDDKASVLGLWREIQDAAGKCRRPIGVTGRLAERDPVTGEVIRVVDTTQLPGGCLLVPCGNRREQVCPPCSRQYKGDTFQVMIAGLRGGHGIPDTVAAQPAVFVTLIAPSFGLVHRGPGRDGQLVQCRPRRDRPVCEHGQPASCGRRHQDGEQVIGQPLCAGCFDYAGAVLFNACVPGLWDQQVQAIRRQLAADTGLSQRALRRHVRLSFGKVAEHQEPGAWSTCTRCSASTGQTDPPTRRRHGRTRTCCGRATWNTAEAAAWPQNGCGTCTRKDQRPWHSATASASSARKPAGPRPNSATRSAPTPSASAATRPARSRRPWTPSSASPRPSTSPSTTCSSTTSLPPPARRRAQPRRPPHRLSEISGDDLASLLHMLDALVAKNRLKTLAGGIS
jgi:hypothetical protein